MAHKRTQTTLLAILDGWGVPGSKGSVITPIRPDTAPHVFSWHKKFLYTELEASGEAVGLFKGQEGNSEAGHLNIGAGRVVKQDSLYISDSIADGSFFRNSAFMQALHHVKHFDSAVHVLGLLSNHNSAHSSPEHLYALLDLFEREGIKKVYLHLFTDGRDSGAGDAEVHLKKLKKFTHGSEKIASIMGRLYGMDRNKNWDRIKLAFETIVLGKAPWSAETAEGALKQAYGRGETDEFIVPTVLVENGQPVAKVHDNDALFFFNVRSDRARELTKAFVQPAFEELNPGAFVRPSLPKNIRFVTMTNYGPDLEAALVAYPSRTVRDSLVQALCPRRQLYIAESEKFPHITYFLNGGYAEHFCGEQFVKVESDRVVSYNKRPEMKAKMVADYVVEAIKSGRYDFIAVNFANADMVGHTGDLKASEIAIKTVDRELDRVISTLLKYGGQGLITADHGNVEEIINPKTGLPDTEHSTSPVPCFIIGSRHDYKRIGIPHTGKLRKGKLANVAPTILKMMGIPRPKSMTAKALF